MKIVAISDIHGHLCNNIPKCDVLCICGDILPLQVQRNVVKSVSWLCQDFKPWAESLPCKHVIFIAGNHDFVFETLGPKAGRRPHEVMLEIFGESHLKNSKLIYLRDESAIIDGVKFYGTPWCPELRNWAFYKSQSELIDIYNGIPNNTDILLTHCPPKIGKVGIVLQEGINYMRDFGSAELAAVLIDKPFISWVLSGHIHSGDHEVTKYGLTNIVNVSIKDENYNVNYKPYEFEFNK